MNPNPDYQILTPLGKFVPLLFTAYPVGLVRARAVLDRIDALHENHADGTHFYLDNPGVLPASRRWPGR